MFHLTRNELEKIGLDLIIFTLIILTVSGISFDGAPSISPNPADTEDPLICSWTPSPDMIEMAVS